MISEKSLANLTPFKEGNPGGGRPKGSGNITTVIERWLRLKHGDLELPDGTIVKIDREDAAVLAQLKKSIGQNEKINKDGKVIQSHIEADTAAFNAIMAYRYGKPIQRTENENREVTDFTTEQEEFEFKKNRIIELQREAINRSGEIVNEAESIIANP